MKRLLANVAKDFFSRFLNLSVNERMNNYRSNFFQYQNMLTEVTMEADKALMTFSIAALAALAALNNSIFRPYGWMSFITLICFISVIALVMIGYYVSKALLIDAQKIITLNFKKSLTTPLGEGLNKVRFSKLSKVINFLSLLLFILGMILFVILMGLYIKEV